MGVDSCGPKEPLLYWGQSQVNQFATAKGDKLAILGKSHKSS